MTLAELIAQTRIYLQEPDSNGRFSDAELTAHINEALRKIAERSDVLVEDQEATVDADIALLELPERTLGVQVVRWNGVRLPETTQQYLDTLDPDWISKTGTPAYYYTTTPNVIRLVPIPDQQGTVRVRYTRSPEPLSTSGDVSELPDFLARLAPYLATAMAHLTDVDGAARAAGWMQLFEAEYAGAARRLAKRTSVPSGLRIRGETRRGC